MTYRIQHKFWLDVDRDDEAAINDEVVYLKRARSFSSTIRDGIRLICDLRAGRLNVLLELFPWVREAMTEAMLSDGAGGNSSQTAAIQRQLNELEKLLLGQNNGAMMTPVAVQAGPKPLAVPKIAAPVLDDDDMPALVVTQAKATKDSAAQFLQSAFGLQ